MVDRPGIPGGLCLTPELVRAYLYGIHINEFVLGSYFYSKKTKKIRNSKPISVAEIGFIDRPRTVWLLEGPTIRG